MTESNKVTIEKEDEIFSLLNYLSNSKYIITTTSDKVQDALTQDCILTAPNSDFIEEKRKLKNLEIRIINQGFFVGTTEVGHIPNLLEEECCFEVYGRKNMAKMEKLANSMAQKYNKHFKLKLSDELPRPVWEIPHYDINGDNLD